MYQEEYKRWLEADLEDQGSKEMMKRSRIVSLWH